MIRYKQMSLLFLLMAAVVFFLCACKSTSQREGTGEGDISGFGPDAPAWARSGELPKYPSSQFITGLGYSPLGMSELDAYNQAKVQAFKDISDQVETHISNEFTSIQRSVFHNEDLDELVDVKSVSKQVTEELLAGAEVVQRYYESSTGTAAALAIMDRYKLSTRLLKEAEQARTELDGYLKGFEQEAQAVKPSAMLKNLIHAQGALDRIRGGHLKAIAVGVTREMSIRFKKLNDPALATRITREVSALRDHIRIKTVKGNEQRARLTGELESPIEVEVFWQSERGPVPVDGFPMHVVVKDEEKATAVASARTTDQAGRYSFILQELKATGASSNSVQVALDFQAVEKRSDLKAPFTEIIYLMPTPDTTRIGVVIFETIDEEENRKPFIGSSIKKALTDIGFQVIQLESTSPPQAVVELPPSQLIETFGSQCEYLVVGTAEAEHSTTMGAIIFYRVRLVIDAIELSTRKTIHFEIPFNKTKSAGDTKNKAYRAAFNKAADLLVGNPRKEQPGDLAKKFIARFEEGADWSDE
jgi:hypothetical protein